MAGPSSHADVAAELATRPGHTNLRSTLVRWLLITVSLTFLGALLAAPLAVLLTPYAALPSPLAMLKKPTALLLMPLAVLALP